MTEKGLSLPEMAALMALMLEGGEAANPQLKETHGITLDGPARRNLNDLKLVESHRQGRSYAHVLTDAGWARLAAEIRTGISVPTKSARMIVRGLQVVVGKFMDHTDLRLADVFAAADEPDLVARIRAAYAQLAVEPGAWVSFTRLRPLLGQAPRPEVDAALTAMIRLPDVNIVPESNQKSLTAQDREAAVIIGDQDTHLISIGAR